MTVKEIREKETGHLKEELAERRKHLFDLRSQAVTEKLEDPSQLRKTRKEIAQMQTILRQRELEGEKNGDAKSADETKKPAGKKAPVKKAAAKKTAPKKAAPKKKKAKTAAAAE